MDSEFEKKLIEILNSDNIEAGIAALPLLDRIKLLNKRNYLCEVALSCVGEDFILINEEEALYLYENREQLNFNIIDYCSNDFVKYPPSFDKIFYDCYMETNNYDYLRFVRDPEVQWKIVNDPNHDVRYNVLYYMDDTIIERLLFDKNWKDERHYLVHRFTDDSYRIKYLNRFGLEFKVNAIASFKSKELKEKYIKQLPPKHRGDVILSFDSDETKKKYITGFVNDKGRIIEHFKKDEDKIEYLEQYKHVLSQEDRANIIVSLDSVENVRKCMKYITKERGIYWFLQRFKYKRDRELCKQLISFIHRQEYIADVFRQLNYDDEEELAMLLVDKTDNQKTLIEMLDHRNLNSEICEVIVSKLTPRALNKYLKDNMEYADIPVLLNCTDIELVVEALGHARLEVEYNEKIRPLVERVAKYYNVNFDHLLTLTKLTNCHILNSLENENIINAINLNEEDFVKYLRIFNEKNYDLDMSGLSSLLTTLLHKRFSFEHPEEIELFINTLHDVDDGKIEDAISKIYQICSVVDISKFNIDINTLINGVLSKDKQIILTYRDMSYEYLVQKRNEFLNEHTAETLRSCTRYRYEKNSFIKFLFKAIPEQYIISRFKEMKYYDGYTEEEKKLLNNEELVISLIKFKKNPNAFGPLTEEMKQNLKVFNDLCGSLRVSRHDYDIIDGINIEYEISPIRPYKFVDLMQNIDTNKLRDLVFSDPELFEELLSHLDKYDMVGWGERFGKISNLADIDVDHNIVGAIISNYALISKTRKEKEAEGKRFPLISELNFADSLDSDANIYSIIIGQEDYRLIRRNPIHNSSPKSKKYRIGKAVELVKEMHKRKYITVPPVNENITLKNGKKINIMVGNTNDPINLTYGERTGACMRIGGAGNSLFEFCLTNENGFHMSFNDPVTGELVSRVSCFRNGNTLFLNQLRNSLSSKYDNEDLVEACTVLCQKLIEMTRGSRYPIENAVASDGYALEGKREVDLKCGNIKRGLPNFYSDVSEVAVVIATSKEDTLSEVKTGPNQAERYPIGRGRIKSYQLKKAIAAVKHIEALDLYYDGTSIENIDIPDKDVQFAYAGEDWYVARLSNGEIITYVQRNSLNKAMAEQEMRSYLRTLEATKTYGGMEL